MPAIPDSVVAFLLLWLFAGSLVWWWLHHRGALFLIYAERRNCGPVLGRLAVALLVILVIVDWPMAIDAFATRARA